MNKQIGENMNAVSAATAIKTESPKHNPNLRLLDTLPKKPRIFVRAWRVFKTYVRSTAKYLSEQDMGLEEWRRIEFKNEYKNRKTYQIQPERWM